MRSMLMMVTVMVLVVAPNVARADDARDKKDQRDLKECEQGMGELCVEMGQRFLIGADSVKDPVKAYAMFVKGCDHKAANGCLFAAAMNDKGDIVGKDAGKALALREKACALDNGGACNDIGATYWDGDGDTPKQDRKKAKALYDKACRLKDGLGCFNYGNLFRLGWGVLVDGKAAAGWFKKSCDLDSGAGCTELARMYYIGDVLAKSHAKATELWEKGCKLGSDVGCKSFEGYK